MKYILYISHHLSAWNIYYNGYIGLLANVVPINLSYILASKYYFKVVILTLKSMLLMILCGIMGFCSPQYFTSVSKANIVLESQISVTAFFLRAPQ